jgi:hypothetical protein
MPSLRDIRRRLSAMKAKAPNRSMAKGGIQRHHVFLWEEWVLDVDD